MSYRTSPSFARGGGDQTTVVVFGTSQALTPEQVLEVREEIARAAPAIAKATLSYALRPGMRVIRRDVR